ncbi:hypothetical protein BKA67DRAFT_654113 [Truncatella angustata]|uniref:Zn(2)-C6 fungal-type domain-containing protein n=1 Tax=Truncatella angustata TaxID=152316 RepID=A0A9P9A4B2_9PEZI|nr:uncharacterized protein BKA67DRAFT_654113 [Truncatella angustata]KAH6660963.1 hypothetical protein BKA67DRAFT_654113 [Truncatella angustata]
MLTPKNGRRKNAKSGCRTCKLRKVKCDERKPSCHRCISAGRVCAGYGIWGGGGNQYGDPCGRIQYPNPNLVTLCRTLSPLGVMTARESLAFEYFVFQSAPRLPGAFASPFWTTLVFQASSNEAAVLSALLALSFAHKNNSLQNDRIAGKASQLADDHEHFILQHYSRAISQLQAHLAAGTSASVRVTLITCLLFICLELLRGQYKSAVSHLESGLKLLNMPKFFPGVESTIDRMKSPYRFEEHWIAVTFGRLYISTVLSGQISRDLYPISYEAEFPQIFCSVTQARHCLDQLLAKVTSLMSKTRHAGALSEHAISTTLSHMQSELKSDFSRWKQVHTSSKSSLETNSSFLESWAYDILEQYHVMGLIMADTCLDEAGELAFDSYTFQFASIIENFIPKLKFSASAKAEEVIPGYTRGTSKSVCDLGAIPPLYYVALKCRVHQIRLQAIKILRLLSHSEGIWHAVIAACVAEEVMRIEEGDFYKAFELDDGFSPFAPPVVKDASLPALPLVRRICQVRVILPNDISEGLVIECEKVGNGGSSNLLKREYNFNSQSWNAA